MHDSIRIRNLDEQTAAALADDALAQLPLDSQVVAEQAGIMGGGVVG